MALTDTWRLIYWVSVAFVYCVETAKDTATGAIECEYETTAKLSSGKEYSCLPVSMSNTYGSNASSAMVVHCILQYEDIADLFRNRSFTIFQTDSP